MLTYEQAIIRMTDDLHVANYMLSDSDDEMFFSLFKGYVMAIASVYGKYPHDVEQDNMRDTISRRDDIEIIEDKDE